MIWNVVYFIKCGVILDLFHISRFMTSASYSSLNVILHNWLPFEQFMWLYCIHTTDNITQQQTICCYVVQYYLFHYVHTNIHRCHHYGCQPYRHCNGERILLYRIQMQSCDKSIHHGGQLFRWKIITVFIFCTNLSICDINILKPIA